MGIIHSKNYSIRKKLFKKIFIQKIWKLFIQKNYSFFWKIDYRPGLIKVYILSFQKVDGATAALQHNLGLGGAVVVALYKLGFPEASQAKAKLW